MEEVVIVGRADCCAKDVVVVVAAEERHNERKVEGVEGRKKKRIWGLLQGVVSKRMSRATVRLEINEMATDRPNRNKSRYTPACGRASSQGEKECQGADSSSR